MTRKVVLNGTKRNAAFIMSYSRDSASLVRNLQGDILNAVNGGMSRMYKQGSC